MAVFLLFPGIAAAFDSLWPLLSAVPLWLYLDRVVVPAEEAFLTREYGAAYTAYYDAAPRWLT